MRFEAEILDACEEACKLLNTRAFSGIACEAITDEPRETSIHIWAGGIIPDLEIRLDVGQHDPEGGAFCRVRGAAPNTITTPPHGISVAITTTSIDAPAAIRRALRAFFAAALTP